MQGPPCFPKSYPRLTPTPTRQQGLHPRYLNKNGRRDQLGLINYTLNIMSAIGPFAEPAPGCKPAAAPALTAEQQTKYDELLADVRTWETLPTTSAKTAETSPISDDERMWLTRECLLRYLRATKWNLPQAVQRLRSTLVWRREYGTDRFTAEYISEENETGKQVLLGFDNEGRPCLYLLPQNQNTKETPKRVEHLVYMLERTIDLHPPGQESLALLIDFRNTGAGGTPSMGIAKQVLDILQNHYPERLGRALLTHRKDHSYAPRMHY